MTEIRVHTRNSLYEITVIDRIACDILIRGGQFFPQQTAAHLSGACLRGSFLKLGCIACGFNMEIATEDNLIVTSQVQTIEVLAPRR